MFQECAKIAYNKRVSKNCFELGLASPKIAKNSSPGQFINVRIIDNPEALLLRRPFSIHGVIGRQLPAVSRQFKKAKGRRGRDCIKILYQAVGKGTQILSEKKTGESLEIIGPLGNGFDYDKVTGSQSRAILVAGGMGVAPLIFLAEKLAERKAQSVKRKTLVLIGAKTKSQVLCENEFKNLGCDVRIATDDGSRGFKGKVTELLRDLLTTNGHRLSTIYACGPKPMLKEVSRIAGELSMPTQLSLEEHMACGIGACMGCVVNTKKGYKRVCKEGPVFEHAEILW